MSSVSIPRLALTPPEAAGSRVMLSDKYPGCYIYDGPIDSSADPVLKCKVSPKCADWDRIFGPAVDIFLKSTQHPGQATLPVPSVIRGEIERMKRLWCADHPEQQPLCYWKTADEVRRIASQLFEKSGEYFNELKACAAKNAGCVLVKMEGVDYQYLVTAAGQVFHPTDYIAHGAFKQVERMCDFESGEHLVRASIRSDRLASRGKTRLCLLSLLRERRFYEEFRGKQYFVQPYLPKGVSSSTGWDPMLGILMEEYPTNLDSFLSAETAERAALMLGMSEVEGKRQSWTSLLGDLPRQLLQAVQVMKDEQVYHNDLKCSNLLLKWDHNSNTLNLQVGDPGCARWPVEEPKRRLSLYRPSYPPSFDFVELSQTASPSRAMEILNLYAVGRILILINARLESEALARLVRLLQSRMGPDYPSIEDAAELLAKQ